MKKCYFLLFCFITLSSQTIWAQWPALGGPDTYGYEWRTNQDENGPTYEWINITTVGTEVSGLTDDNVVGPISMGIDFQYYWNTRSSIWIGSNGYLSFQNGNIASTGIGFPPTPSPSGPNDVIAPFMCDLTATGVGNPARVYYYLDTQNDRFIVSYIDIPFWEDPSVNSNEYTGANSFQVILSERDSTITFQYQKQIGNWNASYDQSANPMVVGIENITGNIGLLVSNREKPQANTAITFYPPVETSLSIADVAPVSLQTLDNTASFAPYSPTSISQTSLSARIANLGNIDINFATNVLARVRDSVGQLVFQQQVSIPSLARGQVEEINFSAPFVPLRTGPFTFSVETSNPADINAENNVNQVELIVIDSSSQEVTLSYASENIFNVFNGDGTLKQGTAGLIDWAGGDGTSGAGALYQFWGYPLIIKALDYFVLTTNDANPNQGFVAELYQVDPTGESVPGQLIFREEVPFDSLFNLPSSPGWTRVNVPISQGVIAQDGFYASYIQENPNIFLLEESNIGPISNQTYEILDGNWAEYRNNNNSDLWMRVVLDISNVIFTKINDRFDALNKFEVYPNPTSGIIQLDLELDKAAPLTVKILDMQGRKVKVDMAPNSRTYQTSYDLSYLPKGIYMVQISTEQGQKTKKIVLR